MWKSQRDLWFRFLLISLMFFLMTCMLGSLHQLGNSLKTIKFWVGASVIEASNEFGLKYLYLFRNKVRLLTYLIKLPWRHGSPCVLVSIDFMYFLVYILFSFCLCTVHGIWVIVFLCSSCAYLGDLMLVIWRAAFVTWPKGHQTDIWMWLVGHTYVQSHIIHSPIDQIIWKAPSLLSCSLSNVQPHWSNFSSLLFSTFF